MDKILENYVNGFPYLKIVAPAIPGKGIRVLSSDEEKEMCSKYEAFAGKVVKFVPASGAASRMFKDLFSAKELLEKGEWMKPGSAGEKFVAKAAEFPFWSADMEGADALSVLNFVLEKPLGYGHLPKGLVLFHKYGSPAEARTAFEEHLVEGALYAASSDGKVHIHFTVSPEHQAAFEKVLSAVREKYEKRFGVKYEISFSTQDPATDIMAVDKENNPFRKADGTVLKRPAGHGALLKNLNAIDADIIILKNIDNVVRQGLVKDTVLWKKVLCGGLIELRDALWSFLRRLEPFIAAGKTPENDSALAGLCREIRDFYASVLSVKFPDVPASELPSFLFGKLNRPIRVCGMVKNEGEPGGGPYITVDADGSCSLQILEKAQMDPNSPDTPRLLAGATHFNPVDVVCCIKNWKGETFDLQKYVDSSTGLISEKSYEGRELKAQELPGLWNGSMSDWNTVFVQTPLSTFNPVKTVLDLLRPEHAGK